MSFLFLYELWSYTNKKASACDEMEQIMIREIKEEERTEAAVPLFDKALLDHLPSLCPFRVST